MLEKKLANWLTNKNYECFYNFPLGGKFPDLIAVKDKELVAFEFKGHVGEREIPTAMGQCLFYLRDANKAYVVIPKEEENLLASSVIEILRDHGIGLITVNDSNIKILLEAKGYRKNNISIIEEIKNRKVVKKTKMKIDVKNKIIETLKEHPEGLTVISISKMLGMSRTTISKYIYGLVSEGLVYQREMGPAKLCYLRD